MQSSDEDFDDDEKCYIVRCHNTALHNPTISSHPTRSDLKAVANRINDEISRINNHGADTEKRFDCVAVGYTTDGQIYVAANVKERFRYPITGFKNPEGHDIKYEKLGLHDQLIEPIKNVLENKLNINGQYKVTVVKQKLDINTPSTIHTNARDHAEMQLLAQAKEDRTEISRMGISKPACRNCEKNLHQQDVLYHQDKEGNQQPRNWASPESIETEVLASIQKQTVLVRKRGFDGDHNIPKRLGEVSHQFKQNIKQQVIPKPGCHITAASILDIIEDIDRDPSARAGTFNAYAGTYEKTRTGRIGAYASASVAEASASVGILGASASVLSASAYAEGGLNWSAGANASLARAEAHAGPVQVGVGLNLNTGVSAGVDGVHASFLGFGFDIGPKLSIQTPIADVSCNVM